MSFRPLSVSQIRAAMSAASYQQLADIAIFDTVSSTNDQLWQRLDEGLSTPAVCLSEHQSAGRGRRGDHWQSPASGNLYLSLFWPFRANTLKTGLSIAIGVSLINTLKTYNINNLKLKWPNDVLVNRQKLAGILVESRFGNAHYTVIGIGLNFKLPIATRDQIQQPTASLTQLCTEVPCRNTLAGQLIQNMMDTLTLFEARGLQDILPLWPQYDALYGKTIELVSDQGTITVEAQGIDEGGALRYQHQGQLHSLSRSDVSIRFAS